ncbi:MAG: CPBP family glutamic-type intramembrane protease, partial [Actinomycetota bacterium]
VGGTMLRFLTFRWAVIVAALAFTLHHIVILWQLFPGPWAVLMSFGVFVAGVFWMWLYKKTGSLIAPWISHAFADLAIFAIGFVIISS